MLPSASSIEEIVTPIIAAKNAFIVGIDVRGKQGSGVIEIFLETPKGITATECAEVSREIGGEFDRLNLIDSRYQLIVSSPGLDKPIKMPMQYPRHVGKRLSVRINQPFQEDPLEGILKETYDDHIVLELEDGQRKEIAFSQIASSRVCLPW